eukprot:3935790-Pyramimonas_sp.AAC.1
MRYIERVILAGPKAALRKKETPRSVVVHRDFNFAPSPPPLLHIPGMQVAAGEGQRARAAWPLHLLAPSTEVSSDEPAHFDAFRPVGLDD